MPFQSRTFSGGGYGTRRDLELREQLALLRELEAQAAEREQNIRMNDPLEAAKASETARQFMTRRDVREVLQPSIGGAPPFKAPSRTSPGTSLMEPLPAAVRSIRRIAPDAGPRLRTFTTAPTMTAPREEAAAVRDPNFPAAYAGREAEARLHPNVLAAEAYSAARDGAGSTITGGYTEERAQRAVDSVDEILAKVNTMSTGYGAAVFGKLPETQARNVAGMLNTLRSAIGFNELTAMREASKTGGALGQVSDRELNLLTSALGALDPLQSPDQLREQLEKVRGSVERWNTARRTLTGGSGATQPSRQSGGQEYDFVPGTGLVPRR